MESLEKIRFSGGIAGTSQSYRMTNYASEAGMKCINARCLQL